ncbi:MAG: two-component system response regulator [Kangiella sp.]|nr:MAG: two-component system response regulator [Kangiella sp.]
MFASQIKKIIIIDDDLSYREILARSLSRLDYQTQHYANPKDAEAAISNDEQCIILLDLKLENDSGLMWIETIKEANPNCHIILLTGYASISTAVEAIKLGADNYLAKPITAREIVSHLQDQKSVKDIPISTKPMSVGRLEWEHIQKVLQDNDGNICVYDRSYNEQGLCIASQSFEFNKST